jgi:LuxR family transcriptional regulator, maltose regulon positive regulatory protein
VAGDHAPRGLAARYGPVQAGGIARKWEVRGILAPWSGRPGGSDYNAPPRRAPLGWALGLLERLHARAATQARTGSLIEIQALQALARSADGDQPGALTALAEALALAAPEGYLRVFVDEGPPMAALLRQLLAAGATNRAVAKELVVTVDTVKRHVSHLFGKLEVANRTQAVARARELGLLP